MATVYEVLYLLFKSDTTDLKKGTDEAEKSTQKLQKSLSAIDKNVLNVGQKFLGLATSFAGLVASVLSAHEILMNFKEAENYATSLSKASQVLGVSAGEIDAWGEAVKRVGGTADDFKNSLAGLSQHLGTVPEIALRVLPLLADAFSRFNRVQAFMYGRSLGLSDSTILLLQKGRKGLDDLLGTQRALGVTTDEDAKAARDFSNAMLDLNQSTRILFTRINTEILPIFTKLIENAIVPFVQYLISHKHVVEGFMIGVTLAAGALLVLLIDLASPVIALTAAFIAFGTAAGFAFDKAIELIKDVKSDFHDFIEEFKRGDLTVTDIVKKWAKYFYALLSPLGFLTDQLGELAGNAISDLVLPEQNQSQNIDAFMTKGRHYILSAQQSPLNSQTSNSVLNSSAFNKNTEIHVGSIDVHTRATDAQGVADSLGKMFKEEFWKTANYFSDGRNN